MAGALARVGNSYLWVAVAIVLIVAAGFGPALDERLIHPPSPRPWILYVHATLFTGWVALLLAQTALVRAGKRTWHRRLGWLGAAMGALIPVVGIATALAMARLNRAAKSPQALLQEERFLVISFFDMTAFGVAFGIAMYCRRRPPIHRRLMLMATCGLTVAAFARLPGWLMPGNAWYGGVDALILAAAVQDWMATRRVHPVYMYGIPLLALGQGFAMWIYLSGQPMWVAIARTLIG